MTASLTGLSYIPQVPQFGTRKFHSSELVSWFHGDSLAITLFILIKAWRRGAGDCSGDEDNARATLPRVQRNQGVS